MACSPCRRAGPEKTRLWRRHLDRVRGVGLAVKSPLFHRSRPRIVRARFQSPGFITIDGSGALEKLIDILHSGDLAKEERRAIIERVRAETDLLRTQAMKQKIEALSGAVAVFQSLGLAAPDILRLLGGDAGLVALLGEPTAELQAAQTAGLLQKVDKQVPENE